MVIFPREKAHFHPANHGHLTARSSKEVNPVRAVPAIGPMFLAMHMLFTITVPQVSHHGEFPV
jgi:hypothetical protein